MYRLFGTPVDKMFQFHCEEKIYGKNIVLIRPRVKPSILSFRKNKKSEVNLMILSLIFFCCFVSFSRSDEAGNAIRGDVSLLSAGYILVIVYLFLVFGRLNCVEQRVKGYEYIHFKIIFLKYRLNSSMKTVHFLVN